MLKPFNGESYIKLPGRRAPKAATTRLPCHCHLMKLFSHPVLSDQQIFNYRLSRARRIVDSCFGILVARFQVFKSEIAMGIATTTIDTTLAACRLYNIMRQKHGANSTPPHLVDSEDVNYKVMYGPLRRDPHRMAALRPCRTHNAPVATKGMRDNIAKYFCFPYKRSGSHGERIEIMGAGRQRKITVFVTCS